MNASDSEVAWTFLQQNGFRKTSHKRDVSRALARVILKFSEFVGKSSSLGARAKNVQFSLQADVILIMTCSIREGAERKIWERICRLKELKKRRSRKRPPLQIGILGVFRMNSEFMFSG